MALRSLMTNQDTSLIEQDCRLLSNKLRLPEVDVVTGAIIKFSEEDTHSLCSTNIASRRTTIESLQFSEEDTHSLCSSCIASKTPTIESLPLISESAEPESDATDWEVSVEETSSHGKHADAVALEKSDRLQAAVEKLFAGGAASLLELKFPVAVADPQLEGCPLIGCSAGFTTLHGYEMADVVGLPSSFLVDPLPDQGEKAGCSNYQEFCLAAAEGKRYRARSEELFKDLPEDRPSNELISVQTSVSKDGTAFETLLLTRILDLGDFDDEQSYIIALQSDLLGSRTDSALLARHLVQLDKNMTTVQKMLGQDFVVSGSMRRQDIDSCSDDDDDDSDLDL
mmetsp:Transcript_27879/g.50975  ORF Transcript_27879/g.50975 Transcript_27879/m.50975 type:complete len:340 (+) Transcript_27879:104-1123(+)